PGDAPQGRRGRAEHGKLEGAGASLRVEQAARGRGVVGSRADAVDRVRREHHESAAPSGGRSLRDGIRAHRPSFWTAASVPARGLSLTAAAGWAWTTRSRPLRSGTTRSTTNPRASAAPEAPRPRDSAISTTAVPPGRSHAAACAKNRSYSSRSPTTARRGSARTSTGAARYSVADTYGGFATTRSTRPARTGGSGSRGAPSRNSTPSPRRAPFARAREMASAERSVPNTRAKRRSSFRASAIAPDPVHASTTMGDSMPEARTASR